MNSRSKLALVTFLTVVRFPLVLVFFGGAIVYSFPAHRAPWVFALTFLSIVLSAVTDIFDGYLARKFEVVTDFGAHADPLMDKFFYLTTLPLLVFVTTKNSHMVHATVILVMTLLFLARDQWVTFLRSIGAMYKVGGGANWSGKLRTSINFPVICAIYFFEESPLKILNATLLHTFEIIAVVINVVSLWVYTAHYWPYLKKSAGLHRSESE